MSTEQRRMNKKKKIVADGVFHAELHSFLQRALVSAGYSGIEIRTTTVKTEIRIKATKNTEVLGVEGRTIRELRSLICKRFGFQPDQLVLGIIDIQSKGLCASAQVESLKMKLLAQMPVRLAANSIIKAVMKDRAGAKGCEVIISGKLKQQRAKTMKFKQGYMISTGQPKRDFIDVAVRHVFFKQGIMGVKVKIMLPYDPKGKVGPDHNIPDTVVIRDPQEHEEREIRQAAAERPQQQQPEQQ
ncbi:Ribosomal protein S3, C-terminal [Pseudocohnilembus persalinus]|uniref:Small ribosomal subunit protein uS3 n=1 Tax=Pseudocohnilembus persalinus TaxID=266149 RepID=A0A0V0QFD9_PSEPJ|nr:Ribosomal protein S3, C-terminal [Pseudocohnilembus persalinus]|eukprot:KRX00907.1 Ribosomal protein S3, C-terminal [Pseudocohnilembus persalinus]